MNRAKNVVWSEGLFLTPHLFQQADRYHENLLHFRLKPLTPFFWGLSELEIDRDGLPKGFFTLYRCSGVMPDGLPVQIPDEDNAPEARSVKTFFAPSAETLDVFLAIPAKHPDALNVTLENGASGRAVRYRMEMARVNDETTEGNESEIPLASKNVQILFGAESLEDKIWIKIAELGRTATGDIMLRESYIPPAISVAASTTLMAILHRILEMLSAKSSALSQQRRHIAEFGTSDVANFWLLHTVNSYAPVLSHLYLASNHHPEALYLALAQLVGELSTFSLETDPRDVPRYDHENLYKTFDDLEQKIRLLLETIIPTKYVIIPLVKTPELWYVGQIHDDRLLTNAQFYLAANAQVAPNRLIEDVPIKSKISSPDEVGALIGRAVQGVALSHEPIPPTAIPVKPGFKYYHLHTSGRWWETICKARRLALYLPDEFPDLKVELVAVRE
ncbi:MAG: type VI secretion system baseplate subunit TssK [Acidobacteria bacterium]|nr:MAG: type VI secretion system baseplate subunit TssK [Verrucomicrobiota bacterium]PYV94740.1 MAG: type VI secretion system baseplate subunit TssK [Acidobacteriota bacterium]